MNFRFHASSLSALALSASICLAFGCSDDEGGGGGGEPINHSSAQASVRANLKAAVDGLSASSATINQSQAARRLGVAGGRFVAGFAPGPRRAAGGPGYVRVY